MTQNYIIGTHEILLHRFLKKNILESNFDQEIDWDEKNKFVRLNNKSQLYFLFRKENIKVCDGRYNLKYGPPTITQPF